VRKPFNYQCSKCGETKTPQDFPGGKHRCRDCVNAYRRAWHASEANREGEAQCVKCGELKPADAFPKGHRRCKECAKVYLRDYYRENKERLNEQTRQYHAQNKEHVNEISRQYYEANSARIIENVRRWNEAKPEKRREYYARNIEAIRARDRERRQAHPEKKAAKDKKWRKSHPVHRQVAQVRRRARKRAAAGSHTVAEWRALVRTFEGRCVCCGKHCGFSKLTEDHVIPLDWGGSNDIGNIQPLCNPCNARKGNRHATDYRILAARASK
jgi:5-methylcytosine-specific restriction endonuclease McrA